MSINIKRCYFHSIEPLKRHKIVKNEKNERRDRLTFMLDSGYLVPSKDLPSIFPPEYQKFNIVRKDDCVYLAQHILTELPSIGGSFHQGEFSAYFEHIYGNPSLVFDEHIIDGKRIKNKTHFLSEEVCIQDRIPLSEIIAIALPYATPAEKIGYFIKNYEELNSLLSDDFKEEWIEEVREILKNKEKAIDLCYSEVQKYQEILRQHCLEIPCIRYDGTTYNISGEMSFLKENENRVKELMKK